MESVLKNIQNLKSNIGELCDKLLQDEGNPAGQVGYPVYGVIGPSMERLGSPTNTPTLQHTSIPEHPTDENREEVSEEEEESEEENEDGKYTVYVCPGLAPAGEMEVRNPMFGAETPVTPPPDDNQEDKFSKL